MALDLLVIEVERFQRLVSDLLEMARLDAGVVPVDVEEVRVAELVTHAVQRIVGGVPLPAGGAVDGAGGAVHLRDDRVEVDPAAMTLVAPVDKRRLMRVLTNLIDNAVRHGGGDWRVEVTAAPGEVLIAVEDRGPGVPPADRKRIFERFARTAATDRRTSGDGAGLGLSLVAEHVAAQQGRVWVEDRPGGGARFVVALPAEEP
jgi:signal transduction histidine kinase